MSDTRLLHSRSECLPPGTASAIRSVDSSQNQDSEHIVKNACN
jgi:hypothetical protein